MSRRTIADAEAELEALAPGLNPVAFRDLQAEVSYARTAAETFSNRVAGDMALEVEQARDDLLQELCDVRDAFATLTSQGQAGRIGAGDYHDQWDALAQRQRAAERTIARLGERAEAIDAIEADPVAYADRFFTNTPNLMPDFSF